MCDYGGKRAQLYNMKTDPGENNNVAAEHPERVERMVKAILKWNATMPKDAGDPTYEKYELNTKKK